MTVLRILPLDEALLIPLVVDDVMGGDGTRVTKLEMDLQANCTARSKLSISLS